MRAVFVGKIALTEVLGETPSGPDATPRTFGALSLSDKAVVGLPLSTVKDSTLELPLVKDFSTVAYI